MIYFINEYLMSWNSGIEHAELKRLYMFNKMHVDAALITRNYDPLLSKNRIKCKLKAKQLLNMFDYFQDAQFYERDNKNYPKIDDLDLSQNYIINPGANVSSVFDGDRKIIDVHFTPGTYGQLYKIDYYDDYGRIIQSTLWDYRGFKSRDQFFDTDHKLLEQTTYDIHGNKVINEYFSRNNKGQAVLTLLELLDYQNQQIYFNSYDELFAFFLTEISKKNEINYMIADRPSIYNSLLQLSSPNIKKYVTFPTNHLNLNGTLMPMYANVLQKSSCLDGIIVSTKEQKDDLINNFNIECNAYNIHFSIAFPDEIKKVSVADRITHKIIAVTRLISTRHTKDIIMAFKQLASYYEDATLDIYGYGEEHDALNTFIDKQDLSKRVKLQGYVDNLEDIYNQAQLYINTSVTDSEPLAIVEALSHGVPSIAYNIKYGPKTSIVNDNNGFLVWEGDIDTIFHHMKLIMDNNEKLTQMSNNAYQINDSNSPFALENVFQSWKDCLLFE